MGKLVKPSKEYRPRKNSAVPDGVTVGYMYDVNKDLLLEVEGVDLIDDALAHPDYPFEIFWDLSSAESMIHSKYPIQTSFDNSIDQGQLQRAKEHWQRLLNGMVKV